MGLTELHSEAQQAALRYTEALTRAADTDPDAAFSASTTDAAFQRFHDSLAEHFTPEEMLEIVAVVVNMNVWTRIKLAETAMPGRGTSSTGHHEPCCSSILPENCGSRGRLVGKVATAFTSSQTEHGGQEPTTLAVNKTLCNPGRRPGVGPGNKTKRLSDTDCVRTSPGPGSRLIPCEAWRMSRSLTASRLRPP